MLYLAGADPMMFDEVCGKRPRHHLELLMHILRHGSHTLQLRQLSSKDLPKRQSCHDCELRPFEIQDTLETILSLCDHMCLLDVAPRSKYLMRSK